MIFERLNRDLITLPVLNYHSGQHIKIGWTGSAAPLMINDVFKGDIALKDDLDKHFPGYKYIFSSGSYPRIGIIASDDGAIHLRLATSDNNYKQIRVNDQGVYADWVGDTTITKQIVTKQ